jgi:hypothetical protein
MNEDLLATIRALRENPAVVVDLYLQLYDGNFWTLVRREIIDPKRPNFLTYIAQDEIRVVPVFTNPAHQLLMALKNDNSDSMTMEASGRMIWPRILNVVAIGECEVELDPGETHGIRLDRAMILGMVRAYDPSQEFAQ